MLLPEELPQSFAQGAKRAVNTINVFNPSEFAETWSENVRGGKLIVSAITTAASNSGPIVQIVSITLDIYFKQLPNCAQQKIMAELGIKAAYYGGRFASKRVVQQAAKVIIQQVVSHLIFKRLLSLLTGGFATLAVWYAIAQEAGDASRRLRRQAPVVYRALRKNNLDMAYFLVEDKLNKYINEVRTARNLSDTFKKNTIKLLC